MSYDTGVRIDALDGTVVLSNGFAIRSTLTQDEFRSYEMFPQARAESYGVVPWVHYRIPGGSVDGKELLTVVSFHGAVLVEVGMTADHYPPGPRDWSGYSLDVEAATKLLHDRLLERMFGASGGPAGDLNRPLVWTFPWGRVSSYHDPKGGGTFITVSYGTRKRDASR